jgi:ferric-dicitrate binding protein FerR (iron transport regulator)
MSMTPTGAMDDDEEIDALLRAIISDRSRLQDEDVRHAIQRLYGRLDTLELLREAAREEQLLRLLHVRTGIDSERSRDALHPREPRVVSISSPDFPARDGARGARWRTIGLAAAAVLVIGLALNWSIASRLLRSLRAGASAAPRTVTTMVAELDTVELPDGSRAILAPNSSLRYTISPRSGPRELQLEGEAYFDVLHDAERPFRVRTRHAVVEDLGTVFVVREYAGDPRTRVAVRSGAAALHARDDSGASPIELRPGDGAYVDSSGAIARFTGDPERYGSWTSGRFEFDAAPLPEVLSELGSWYGVEFRMDDSTLERQYFTGSLEAASLTKLLDILGPVVHARFERVDAVVVVTSRPDKR